MRKMLSILLGLLMVLPCGAATIQWYHQMPRSNTLADGMMIVFENQGSNGYSHTPLSTLRSYVGGTSSASPITNIYVTSNYVTTQFVTNQYVDISYVDQTFITNQYVLNSYTTYNTNLYSYITNLYVTQEYVTYLTNSYAYITNLEVVNNLTVQSNSYFYETNFVNYDVVTNLTVLSNAYFYETNFVNYEFVTNLTVVNELIANMDDLTNSAGYSGAAMVDTNWVLGQIASLGAYLYFGGPTNSFAITNSGETVSRTNVFTGSISPFTTASTSTIPTLVLNAYARHVISTNKVNSIESGPISISTYPFRSGGAGTVSGHFEFYAVDAVSNIMYELGSTPVIVFSATTPTRVESSLTLTNSTTWTNGAYFAIALKMDSIGSGGPQLHFAHGGVYDAHATFTRPLSSATIQASQIAGTITNTIATPGTVTATAFQTYTNSWAGPSNTLDLSKGWVKYAAITPCAVTGVTGKQAAGTAIQHTLLTITNAEATNITLYYTGPVRTGDGARSWTITNATVAKLAVEYDPNGDTNIVFRLFY